MDNQLPLDLQLLKKGALVLRAIKNDLRQQILQLVHRRQRLTVTEIYSTLRIEQSVTSQQLGILRKQGFVNAEREGKHIYYSINYDRLNAVKQIISKMVNRSNDRDLK